MKAEDIRLFKIIGKIQTAIASSGKLDEAVRTGMKLILENSMADHAIIWYAVKDQGKLKYLKPYYWLCPTDLTSISYTLGEGIPGRVFANEKREVIPDLEKEADKRNGKEFSGLNVGSVVCVPLCSEQENLGCVEFLKNPEHGPFQRKKQMCVKS